MSASKTSPGSTNEEFVPDENGFDAPSDPIPRRAPQSAPAEALATNPPARNSRAANETSNTSTQRPDRGTHAGARARPSGAADDHAAKPHATGAPFTPWDRNFQNATMAMGFALAVMWIMAALGYRLGALAASGLFAAWSLYEFSTGLRRRFGKLFEEKHVRRARKVIAAYGFKATANLMTKVGDVDLLVEERYRFNVEIKSWRSYGDNPKFAKRERAALLQMGAQRAAADTHGSILWLPQATNTLWQSLFTPVPEIGGNTWVVKGNARRLGKAVRKLMSKKPSAFAEE